MGFFSEYDELEDKPAMRRANLNSLIDKIKITPKLTRDVTRHDRTAIVDRIIAATPARLLLNVPKDAYRAPYSAHLAGAICERFSDEYRDIALLRGKLFSGIGNRHVSMSDPRVRQLIEKYGRREMDDALHWVAAEEEAREAVYGTRAIYWRWWYSSVCVAIRRGISCDLQPSSNWNAILCDVVSHGILKPVGFMRCKGVDFPVLKAVYEPASVEKRESYRHG